MSYEQLDREYDRRGGRGKKRVGIDYTLVNGTSALAIVPQPEPQPEPAPILPMFRKGDTFLIERDGAWMPVQVESFTLPHKQFHQESMFKLRIGSQVLIMGFAALCEAKERARQMLDVNVPQLPARILRLINDYVEPPPQVVDLKSWGVFIDVVRKAS